MTAKPTHVSDPPADELEEAINAFAEAVVAGNFAEAEVVAR